MKYLLLLLLLLCCQCTYAQDYTAYYAGINKAEEQCYLKEDMAAGLKTYIQTFSKYDFVFVQDCFEALQLALYANDERSFLTIANKATLNGWQPQRLSNMMSYLKNHPLFIKDKDTLMAMYHANRPHYLARIDTAALKKMYMLVAYDQLEKNNLKGEGNAAYTHRYKPQIKETMDKLQQLIAVKGWPSDKLLGINQDGIMHELRTGILEMTEFYRKHKDEDGYNVSEGQFTFEVYNLTNDMMFPILLHYASMWKDHFDRKRYLLYPDSFYHRQILAGKMHPKDYGFQHDYALGDTSGIPDPAKGEKYFAVGLTNNILIYYTPERIPDVQINSYRQAWFMGTMDVQRAKLRFMRKNKMFMGWGFFACRS